MNQPMRQAVRSTYKLIVAVLGTTIIVCGLILLFLPGPGMVVAAVGLGLLASEFAWARRLLRKAKKELQKTADTVRQ